MKTKLRGFGVGENGTPPRDGLVRALAPGADPLLLQRDDSAPEAMPVMETTFAVFDRWTEINSFFEGNFMETMAPGSFKKTMKENAQRVKVTFNHGHDPQLGDKVLGPIEAMRERSDIDPSGAWASVPLLDTSYNRDLIPGLEAGVYGASFRFRVLKEEFDEEPGESEHNPKGVPERTVKEVQLFEFGPVTFPAYADATAGLRSLTDEFIVGRMVESPDQLRSLIERALEVEAATMNAANTREDNSSTFFPGTVTDVTVTGVVTSPEDLAVSVREEILKNGRQDEALAPEPTEVTPAEPTEEVTPVEASREDDADTTNERNEMRTVEEMAQRVSEIDARLREIDQEHAGDLLEAEIRGEWDTLLGERDELRHRIAEQRERRSILEGLDGDDRHQDPTPKPLRRNPLAGNGQSRDRLPDNIYDLEEYRGIARTRDDHRELLIAGAMRSVDAAIFPHERAPQSEVREHIERLMRSFGDDDKEAFARTILVTGSPIYARAFDKMLRGAHLTPEEDRALSMSGSAGGFAVPYVLDPTIIPTSNGVVNPLRQIARIESIIGNEWRGVSSQGVTVSYSAEATQSADNAPVLAQPTASVEKAQAFVPYSIEIGQDWQGLQTEMAKLIQDGKDEKEADKFVTGLGGSVDEPEGLLVGATAIVTTTAATTLAVGDLYKLEEALGARFQPNARFVGAKSQFNRVRQLDTTGGSALWARLGEGTPPLLLDYPAHQLSSMPTALTSGASIITFGDFSHFLIVDRVGLTIEVIPHLVGANQRPTGQRGLYAYWRNTSKVLAWQAFRTLKVT